MGDDTRREILRLLAAGDMTAGDIARAFTLSRSTVSHHLGVLKNAGLVTDERRGQHVVYCLNTTVFQDVAAWVLDVARSLKARRRAGARGRGHGPGGS
ncbi:MAG: winged helix-turn-helix transcriptional regulator [Firmicutes bacterium]|nr:winged helix-turn-helix transcriptional regulator [Bacillota bacterium]